MTVAAATVQSESCSVTCVQQRAQFSRTSSVRQRKAEESRAGSEGGANRLKLEPTGGKEKTQFYNYFSRSPFKNNVKLKLNLNQNRLLFTS